MQPARACARARARATALVLLALSAIAGVGATPVEKVVGLVKELQERLEADQAHEQQVYDKFACWCEQTTKRKAAAIEEAQLELRTFGQQILRLKGTIATRTREIEELTSKISENEAAQAEATAIRTKENEEWQAESTEMKQAIAALEMAIKVLRTATAPKKEAAATTTELLQAAPALAGARAALAKLSPRGAAALPPAKLALLERFAAAAGAGRAAEVARYAPQSATIQGILAEMYDTFAADLETSTSAEATKNRNFEDFIASKQKELIEMKKILQKREKQKAEAEMMLAESTQAYDDTTAQLKADTEFFDLTKDSCTAKSEEWGERKALRTEELEAIAKCLEILSSDDAREAFGKAMGPTAKSFLQLAALTDLASSPSARAYTALKRHGARAHSLRLARVAAMVHLAKVGHFDEVIAEIDKLIETLKEEEAGDILKRDTCKDEFLQIKSNLEDLTWKIEKNEAKIEKLESLIVQKEKDISITVEDIESVTTEIADMEETRKEENARFKQAKTDDEKAIELLEEAKDALAKFYSKNKIELGPVDGSVKAAALAQQPKFKVSEDQAPDATFSHKGKRKNESKGIVSLLSIIIEDLQTEIKDGMSAEAKAQLDFEDRLAAAKKLKEELETKVENLKEAVAQHKSDKEDEQALLTGNQKDKDDELAYEKEIKPDCDWIIGKFKLRREKRAAEMEGLTEAKEFLAGYQPPKEGAFALLDATGARGLRGAAR